MMGKDDKIIMKWIKHSNSTLTGKYEDFFIYEDLLKGLVGFCIDEEISHVKNNLLEADYVLFFSSLSFRLSEYGRIYVFKNHPKLKTFDRSDHIFLYDLESEVELVFRGQGGMGMVRQTSLQRSENRYGMQVDHVQDVMILLWRLYQKEI